jgi:thimet oligopeptidase
MAQLGGPLPACCRLRGAMYCLAYRFRILAPLCGSLALSALLQAQGPPASVKAALAKADAEIAKIVKVPKARRSFFNTIEPLDAMAQRLDMETSMTAFYSYVSTNADERAAGRAADEALTNWYTALLKREDLYRAVKEYADTKPKLMGEQKRFLEFTLRDFRRSGMALPKDKRDQLQKLEEEENKLSIEFDKNIAEDASTVLLTKEELAGVPEDVLSQIPISKGLYVVPVYGPLYVTIMENAENRLTRQRVWTTNKRRGGEKNVEVLEKLIQLRADAAKLLGYKNYVDYAIETRMAKNSETVSKFYAELAPLVQKKRDLDVAELTESATKWLTNGDSKMQVWDYAFVKNQMMKEKYAVDNRKVAEYFPVERVFEGLFSITSKVFGIEYRDITANAKALGLPLWHEDVKLWEVVDSGSGKSLGRIYTDLYPRPNKYTHAACWGLVSRKVWPGGAVTQPLAALVCNFTKPTADKPSLLTHDQVETFFHEFGHALHHMFTETSMARFSGTSVARDFVEAPSQMMENWVWDADVLATFAKHYKTGEPLPKETLDGMIRARTFGSGIETAFQLFLGKMDQRFHTEPEGKVDTNKVYHEVFAEVLPYEAAPETFYHASFGHLTGYQGAYYGYLWSLVYAQDLWGKFEEMGPLNPEAGKYYRKKILARGGSADEMEMLRDYLGREPKMDAFLKHLGLGGGD